MKFLGLTQNDQDLTRKDFVLEKIEQEGGKIDSISVNGVQQEIINKNVNIDISGKADKTAVPEKELTNVNGKSQIMNESDGGGIFFVKNDNTRKSFVGVNDSTLGGPDAQIYAIDPSNSNYGAKVDITKDGIYYTVGSSSYAERIADVNEIATIGDIQATAVYTIKKLDIAETGYLASYQLRDAADQPCGATINIAKDLVINKAELKTCTEEGVPEGCHIGDKYIDFTVNTLSGASHIYLNVKDLVDVYKADEDTLTLDSSTNTFSISEAFQTEVSEAIGEVDNTVAQEIADRQSAVNAIDSAKIDKPVEPVVGQGVNVPYYFDVTYGADKVTVNDYTIDLLDKSKAPQQFSLDVNAATVDKAGLMSAADKSRLDNIVIPTKTSELINDVPFLTEHQSLAAYRSSAAQDTIDAGKQSTLVSGTNIKTVNGESLIGSGNINTIASITVSHGVVLDDEEFERVLNHTAILVYNNREYLPSRESSDISTYEGFIQGIATVTDTGDRELNSHYLEVNKATKVVSAKAYSDDYISKGHYDATSNVAMSGKAVAEAISTKQDTISDLETIRSGATAGATALQSVPSTYRTAAEQDAIHDSTKQDTILDLATIRSGATAGATALQSVPSTYRTAAEQDAIHDSTKQDVISDLTTIRNGAALGATSIQSHQDISGKANITYVDTQISTVRGEIPTNLSELSEDTDHQLVSQTEKTKWNRIPDAPITDGTYTLECTVVDGTATYNWVAKA